MSLKYILADTLIESHISSSSKNALNSGPFKLSINNVQPEKPREYSGFLAIAETIRNIFDKDNQEISALLESKDYFNLHCLLIKLVESPLYSYHQDKVNIYSDLLTELMQLEDILFDILTKKQEVPTGEIIRSSLLSPRMTFDAPSGIAVIKNSPLLSPLTSPTATLSYPTRLSTPSPRVSLSQTDIPKEIMSCSYENLITFKLFAKLSQQNILLPSSVYVKLAIRIMDHYEVDKSVVVLNSVPKSVRDLDFYKLFLFLLLSKRPKDEVTAVSILKEATESHKINEQEKTILALLYNSMIQDAKWSDLIERYESAKKSIVGYHGAHLDNAIMEVCLSFSQYEYGWSVYEALKEIDYHTLVIAITICWRATMSLEKYEGDDLDVNEIKLQQKTWEARAWAVYGRVKNSDIKMHETVCHLVKRHLDQITRIVTGSKSPLSPLSQTTEIN